MSLVDKVLKGFSKLESLGEVIQIPSDTDWIDHLKGGNADNMKPSDFDREQLTKGLEDEMEHTSDIMIALEIAMDHLSKDPNYYSTH